MLSLLWELLVSIAVCITLAYFALLSVPVEADEAESAAAVSVDGEVSARPGADADGAFPGTGHGEAAYDHTYKPLLLPPHKLPLYTTITRCVSLAEGTTLGVVYRWLLINGLRFSPREVYSERALREWGYGRSFNSFGRAIGGSDVNDSLGAAGRSRRRLRQGTAAVAAPPTPLRKESAHWVNVLIRCAAFLCLGGGTVKPEVWTDHLLYGAENVLDSVSAGYEKRMQVRAAEARGEAAPSVSPAQSSRFLTAPRKPLLRIHLLELGSGLLGGASRGVRHPPLSLHHSAGDAAGGSAAPPRAAAPVGHAAALAPARSPSIAASATEPSYHHHHSSSATSSGHCQQTKARAALDATSSLLSSSVAGLSTAIADAVSSVTTRGTDSARLGESVGGTSIAEYTSSAGAQLGVVLPRVEGEVISVEQAYSDGIQKTPPAPAASHVASAHAPSAPASAMRPSSLLPQAPATSPLRCFAVPLLYEDQRFHLRFGCCLPLAALLPASLCVPPDALTLDCTVAVHRVIFSGHLYAAFHGSRVELSFPTAPLFTAVVKVMPDTNDASSVSGSVSEISHQGVWGMRTSRGSGAHTGAAAATAFTATYTACNEATAVGGSTIGGGRHLYDTVARPPLPLRPGLYSSSSNATFHYHRSGVGGRGSGGGGASGGGSCVTESNEKVQEVVLLAVRRLVQSLTHPKVLVGELVCQHPSGSGGAAEGGAETQLQLKWTRQTASLPLCM
ncbi:hypothetical protein LSCM1_07545 [Leishmania martiniquensis]|uniref:Uncharacterized protein n=1 Tax=Leishmania martiniquensis TaxID=1580590 RepID=A0A836H219_9TRYP|nr:hypothetical protein LSCM1_07545 [Leishmania martiniquensis]